MHAGGKLPTALGVSCAEGAGGQGNDTPQVVPAAPCRVSTHVPRGAGGRSLALELGIVSPHPIPMGALPTARPLTSVPAQATWSGRVSWLVRAQSSVEDTASLPLSKNTEEETSKSHWVGIGGSRKSSSLPSPAPLWGLPATSFLGSEVPGWGAFFKAT